MPDAKRSLGVGNEFALSLVQSLESGMGLPAFTIGLVRRLLCCTLMMQNKFPQNAKPIHVHAFPPNLFLLPYCSRGMCRTKTTDGLNLPVPLASAVLAIGKERASATVAIGSVA